MFIFRFPAGNDSAPALLASDAIALQESRAEFQSGVVQHRPRLQGATHYSQRRVMLMEYEIHYYTWFFLRTLLFTASETTNIQSYCLFYHRKKNIEKIISELTFHLCITLQLVPDDKRIEIQHDDGNDGQKVLARMTNSKKSFSRTICWSNDEILIRKEEMDTKQKNEEWWNKNVFLYSNISLTMGPL